MKTQNVDLSKLKDLVHVVEKFLAIIISVMTIGNMAVVSAGQTIEIIECRKEEETHVEEEYATYFIEIEPPIGVAKLCVQGYIQVTYGDVQQVILLDNLYTQNVYKGNAGKFFLLKRPVEEIVVNALQKELEQRFDSEKMDLSELKLKYDTVLCFIYNEDAQSGTYYLLNATQTQKISGGKARRILNTKYETLRLDVENYDDESITTIVDDLFKNIQ